MSKNDLGAKSSCEWLSLYAKNALAPIWWWSWIGETEDWAKRRTILALNFWTNKQAFSQLVTYANSTSIWNEPLRQKCRYKNLLVNQLTVARIWSFYIRKQLGTKRNGKPTRLLWQINLSFQSISFKQSPLSKQTFALYSNLLTFVKSSGAPIELIEHMFFWRVR